MTGTRDVLKKITEIKENFYANVSMKNSRKDILGKENINKR